jgi:hypothetical protein
MKASVQCISQYGLNEMTTTQVVPLHAVEAHGERGGIAPTHS